MLIVNEYYGNCVDDLYVELEPSNAMRDLLSASSRSSGTDASLTLIDNHFETVDDFETKSPPMFEFTISNMNVTIKLMDNLTWPSVDFSQLSDIDDAVVEILIDRETGTLSQSVE